MRMVSQKKETLVFMMSKRHFGNISRGLMDEIKRPLVDLKSERNTVKDIGHFS